MIAQVEGEFRVQINNVNSEVVEQKQLIMLVNMCCEVPLAECSTKHSVYIRVMRSTNAPLNADVSPPVKERCLRWMTWSNLFNWFENFKAFLVEFNFAGIGDDGELTFTEHQLHWIKNIDKMELALNGNTQAGGNIWSYRLWRNYPDGPIDHHPGMHSQRRSIDEADAGVHEESPPPTPTPI